MRDTPPKDHRSGMIWMGHRTSRALILTLSAWLAGVVISWAAVMALLILSLLWPGNPIPPSLLSAWVIATAVAVILPWPPDYKWSTSPKKEFVAVGPFLPLFRAGLACRSAYRDLRRMRSR